MYVCTSHKPVLGCRSLHLYDSDYHRRIERQTTCTTFTVAREAPGSNPQILLWWVQFLNCSFSVWTQGRIAAPLTVKFHMLPLFLGNRRGNRQITFKNYFGEKSEPLNVELERGSRGKHRMLFEKKLRK
jgi:hypothetical protein